ncbi:hypothetical protein FG87_31760 [Nocardia vulneris]|uniref:Uncharacterized protein n=1 Tax=Nocardia vulneris TaxID=1141657 RepID=A0ABR4Z7R2_9NOCA|nr:hypothetical protein FG87_31760 [Nocardia vulneris]
MAREAKTVAPSAIVERAGSGKIPALADPIRVHHGCSDSIACTAHAAARSISEEASNLARSATTTASTAGRSSVAVTFAMQLATVAACSGVWPSF